MINVTAYVWGGAAPEKMPHGADQHTEGPANNSIPILTPHADDAKAFASVGARAALLGHTLQRCGGGFLIGRWGQTREFDSLADAAQWLDRIGGAK